MASADKTYATGKRKLAICRAWGHSGSGQITVNGKSIESYFPRATHRAMITYPLEITNLLDKIDIQATILGGGTLRCGPRCSHGAAVSFTASAHPKASPPENRRGDPHGLEPC